MHFLSRRFARGKIQYDFPLQIPIIFGQLKDEELWTSPSS